MPQGRYERYGLTANPFRELASDSQLDPEIYHVNLSVDTYLRSIKEEALDKQNHAIVVLAGPNGVGKTERLRVAEYEAKERGACHIYYSIDAKPQGVIAALSAAVLKAVKLEGFLAALAPPKWYRDLTALSKKKGASASGGGAGKALGEALSAQAPTFLLINDLHNLAGTPEAEPVLVTLQELGDSIKPGVLVMIGSYANFLTDALKGRPALAARVNRLLALPPMERDEAALMLAKKMLPRRLVEQLDPIYPFDDGAIDVIVQRAAGNPRKVLSMADRALEYAVDRRAYRVDADAATKAIGPKVAAAPSAAVPPKPMKGLFSEVAVPTPPLPPRRGK